MATGKCEFGTLFSKSVPHILENIFFFLDYKSYLSCLEVNATWRELLTSERYKTRAKSVFREEISKYAGKLHRVVVLGNIDKARKLLDSGLVDVNIVSAFGVYTQTPLHVAASAGNRLMVKFLLENGADIKIADGHGRTPLHLAAFRGHKEVSQLLIDNGADLNPFDTEGQTPMHWAARKGNVEVAQLLIHSGADIDKADNGGRTPFSWAVRNGQTNVLQLLDNGADII